MLPRLYRATTKIKDYNNNGLGFFDACKKCEVTEERNGKYTLYMEINRNDRFAHLIDTGMLIKAKPNSKDAPQLFYITKTEIDKYGDIKITANHIKYLFFQNCTIPQTLSTTVTNTPSVIMGDLLKYLCFDNIFSFSSNITSKKQFSLGYNEAVKIGDIFGDEEKGLISVFGGEMHYDNFKVALNKSRGTDSGCRIMYGKNISDYNQIITNDDIYTHIMPYAKMRTIEGEEVTITATEPYFTGIYRTFNNVFMLDCSSKVKKADINPINGEGFKSVRDDLQKAVAKYKHENELKTTNVSITVTYQSELDKLQKVALCDTVKVITNNESIKTKVTKTVYDSLNEKYVALGIGDQITSLSDFLKIQRRLKRNAN